MIEFSSFTSEKDNSPVRQTAEWHQLVELLNHLRTTPCTAETCLRSKCIHKTGLAWSPAVWPEGETRARNTVAAVHALVIDIDHQKDLQVATQGLLAYRRIVHASHSDKDDDRCIRVVVALSRPVLGSEWGKFWEAAMAQLGVPVDESTKDASRLYFLPTRPTGTNYHFENHDGTQLDVDALLGIIQVDPDEKRFAVAKLLAAAWPKTGRHMASLALCGALAHSGWDEETIADFVATVCELAESGNADLEKRLAQARSAVAKIETDDPVSGWPTLEKVLGASAVESATKLLSQDSTERFRRLLGLGTPNQSAEVEIDETPISSDELRNDLETKMRSYVRTSGTTPDKVSRARHGSVLRNILKGEPIVTSAEVQDAFEVLLKYAPPAATNQQLAEIIVKSFCCTPDRTIDDAIKLLVSWRPTDFDVIPKDDADLRSKLKMSEAGPKSCPANIELILRYAEDLKSHIRFNVITKEITVDGGRFVEEDVDDLPVAIMNWMDSVWGIATNETSISSQLLRIARHWNTFNPVKEYLYSVKWDGVPRLGGPEAPSWLTTYCNADLIDRDGSDIANYVRCIGARFMIAAVARALNPGSKVDTVLVLEGSQGAGKSTAFDILGGSWFTDTPIVIGDKDSRMLAANSWICELAELASLVRTATESQKAFISARVDKFRPPYGRSIKTFHRCCVFAGTVNPLPNGDLDYLQDETGDRRWWPVRVGEIDVARLRADRDQLWAEAVRRYISADLHPDQASPDCKGERWWFTREEQIIADRVAAQRHREDPWSNLILEWARKSVAGQTGLGNSTKAQDYWAMDELAKGALGLEPKDLHKNQKLLGAALRSAGFKKEKRTIRSNGKSERHWVWCHPELSIQQIPAHPVLH